MASTVAVHHRDDNPGNHAEAEDDASGVEALYDEDHEDYHDNGSGGEAAQARDDDDGPGAEAAEARDDDEA